MLLSFEQKAQLFQAAVKNFNVEEALKAYNGKTGCACGCGGNYTETTKSMRATTTRMKSKLNAWGQETDNFYVCKSTFENEYYFGIEMDGRASRVYTTQDLSEFLVEHRNNNK